MDYLALPVVLRNGYLDRCSLEESITYSIGLLLSSRPGIMPFEPEYGCSVWEKEFSDLFSVNKADIRASLRNAIGKFEKRLYNVSVSFDPLTGTGQHPLGLVVRVSGEYREDDEEKHYDAQFNLG